MKNMRKEAVVGLLLVAAYLVLRFVPRSSLFMGLLLAAGVALFVIGNLPDAVYQKVKAFKDKLMKR